MTAISPPQNKTTERAEDKLQHREQGTYPVNSLNTSRGWLETGSGGKGMVGERGGKQDVRGEIYMKHGQRLERKKEQGTRVKTEIIN